MGAPSGAAGARRGAPPKAPTGGAAAPRGPHRVPVHGTAPADNGAGISGYIVTPYIGTVAKAPHQFNNTATTQSIAGLTTGQKYTFKVSAINARGTGPKSAASNVVTVA